MRWFFFWVCLCLLLSPLACASFVWIASPSCAHLFFPLCCCLLVRTHLTRIYGTHAAVSVWCKKAHRRRDIISCTITTHITHTHRALSRDVSEREGATSAQGPDRCNVIIVVVGFRIGSWVAVWSNSHLRTYIHSWCIYLEYNIQNHNQIAVRSFHKRRVEKGRFEKGHATRIARDRN